ncbi:hypothetical protein AsFPU1_0964 [Aphanothece sacrum FPU1]|uniref:Uncharacterized protein n=1 Tax=Aphanothece sacrum FPU1 TaxID=1920663 RepID=A0A401IE63_APHSA|nr:hypothetical protein AsFPU1_0964 [Aphanothece sacrum FPU1]GBF86268.1 hypothetical protein AsFPU3_3339 [Aphanothece sacrum FPU3]
MSDDDLKKLIESNARAIEALTDNFASFQKEWQKDREEWQKDRRGIYQLLGQLTRSMSDFYEVQSDFYRRFDQIDERQARMTEILDRLSPPENKQ